MNKKILSIFLLLFLLGIFTACTHRAFGQRLSPAAAASSGASSADFSEAPKAASSGTSAAGRFESSPKNSASAQNEELQKVLNNLNSIGNSADHLDKADSSDLAIPGN